MVLVLVLLGMAFAGPFLFPAGAVGGIVGDPLLTPPADESYRMLEGLGGIDGSGGADPRVDRLLGQLRPAVALREWKGILILKLDEETHPEKLVASYLEGKKPPQSESSLDALTQRERQILKMIAEGYKNRKIAEYLCISVKTVEKHRSNLMKKLDLHNASELTAFAIENGLITP